MHSFSTFEYTGSSPYIYTLFQHYIFLHMEQSLIKHVDRWYDVKIIPIFIIVNTMIMELNTTTTIAD